MKRIAACLCIVILAFTMLTGCPRKNVSPLPDQPQTVTSQNVVDFWNRWFMGLILPAAGTAAAIAVPGAAPLIGSGLGLLGQLNVAVQSNDPTKVENLSGQIANVVNDINTLMPKK